MQKIMELVTSYPDNGQFITGKKYIAFTDEENIALEVNGKCTKLDKAMTAEFKRLTDSMFLSENIIAESIPTGMPVLLKWEFSCAGKKHEGVNKIPQKLSSLINLFRFFTDDYSPQPDRIHDAVIFATHAHAGQLRKGTDIPYITHPLEVWQLLTEMNADENLQIAGILHDVVEDTAVTLPQVKECFGSEVARLVASHTEEEGKSWAEQKRATIEIAKKADKPVQMLIMADKISNLKSMYNDYIQVGEKLWKRFGSTKEMQSAHNSRLRSALLPLSEDEDTARHYKMMVDLYMQLYVDYYIDYENGYVYEDICGVQKQVYMRKADMWNNISDVPPQAVKISRKQAERIISIWQEEHR